jgi:hypothetical protein
MSPRTDIQQSGMTRCTGWIRWHACTAELGGMLGEHAPCTPTLKSHSAPMRPTLSMLLSAMGGRWRIRITKEHTKAPLSASMAGEPRTSAAIVEISHPTPRLFSYGRAGCRASNKQTGCTESPGANDIGGREAQKVVSSFLSTPPKSTYCEGGRDMYSARSWPPGAGNSSGVQ